MQSQKSGKLSKIMILFLLTIFVGTVVSGQVQADICGTPMSTRLIAGQHLDVGTVTITNDDTYLYVQYLTDGDWNITETHLDVATSPEQLKQTRKGNAIPGRFAYATQHDPGVYEVTHTIDITAWPAGTELYLAAHAVVISANGSETAWGQGVDFPGNNWAMYVGYELQLCTAPPVYPGVIEFQDPNISEMENMTSIAVTLARTNGSDGDVSVDIVSSDITATLDEDYAELMTTVIFADGETSKQVTVYLLNDQLIEGDEQFLLTLTNVVGAEIGPQDTATITILDDDEEMPF